MSEERLNQKKQQVEEIAEKMKEARSVVIVDYLGLTVEQDTNLRNELRDEGVYYKVIKNNILSRAAKELDIEGVEDYFKGPTAAAFGLEDAVSPAKILAKHVKDTKKIEIKGGILNHEAISAERVDELAKLPSREELLAKMVGSMNAPISNFVGVLSAIPRSLVYALNAVREQKEQAE